MRKVKLSRDYGIHTIELYAKNLKYMEVQKIIEFLVDHGKFYTQKSDPYNIDRHLKSSILLMMVSVCRYISLITNPVESALSSIPVRFCPESISLSNYGSRQRKQ